MSKSEDRKSEGVLLRLGSAEKKGFVAAARIAGAPLAVWMRERLRQAAVKELESAGQPIPFLQHALKGNDD
jgi:hypothetical protein